MNSFDRNKVKVINSNLSKVVLLIAAILLLFWLLVHNQLNYRLVKKDTTNFISTNTIGEIQIDTKIVQEVHTEADFISKISVKFHTYGRVNNTVINLKLYSLESNLLYQTNIDSSKLVNDSYYHIYFDMPIKVNGSSLSLIIEGFDDGVSPTVWIDNTKIDTDKLLLVNGERIDGTLNYDIEFKDYFPFDFYYLVFSLLTITCLLFILLKLKSDILNGKKNYFYTLIKMFKKYRFLLNQLISRDFKTKYRRSALGVVWSFLNPLLTMIVQYVVFSSIFRSSIENFPVYLLSAIIVFNFFSESSNLSLTSVTSNAPLITKVYIPKYVFPISRVLSSSINFGLSFIPLVLVMLLTGQSINLNIVLILYSVFFTIVLFIGFGFILSTLLVFFRDMQFLWSVLLLIWMYATPLFYPASIIPERFSFILDLNPIYHIISFNRTILLNGVSPELSAYFSIAFSSILVFVFGAYIFKKSQDKFIFYL